MGKTKRLSEVLQTLSVFIPLSAVILLLGLWSINDYLQYRYNVEEVRISVLSNKRAILKEKVGEALSYIQRQQKREAELLREALKTRVDQAAAFSESIYHTLTVGGAPLEEKKMKDCLRKALVSFGKDSIPFFVNDKEGSYVLYPLAPEKEGSQALKSANPIEASAALGAIRLLEKNPAGFYEYLWEKPGQTDGFVHPKLAYLRALSFKGWYIGSAAYLDSLTGRIQEDSIGWISSLHFDGDSSFFAGTLDGVSVIGPAPGKNMWDAADRNGKKVVQELIRTAQSGGGFIEYEMPEIVEDEPFPKLSYAVLVPGWNWYLGAGYNLNDVSGKIKKLEADYARHYLVFGLLFLLLSACVAAVSVAATRKLTGSVRVSIESFTGFFRNASASYSMMDLSVLPYTEFQEIGGAANDMIESHRRIQADLQSALNERGALLKEIHHRVKNNLQVIQSILSLKLHGLPGEEEPPCSIQDCIDRIQSMSLIHEQIYQSELFSAVEIKAYIETLVQRLRTSISGNASVSIFQHIEDIRIPLDAAVPLGLIVNELVTNVFKHAFPGNREGRIDIGLKVLGKEILFTVEDNGVGFSPPRQPEASSSLGLKLIDILVKQLNGTCGVEVKTGVRWSIRLPNPNGESSPS